MSGLEPKPHSTGQTTGKRRTLRQRTEDAYRGGGADRIGRQLSAMPPEADAFLGTVDLATKLSAMRDPCTAGHVRRVGAFAMAIGAELGFDARAQEGIRIAGYLHDIGKISIPTEILSKPGKISPIEYLLIQGHAQAGFDLLKGVKFPWEIASVALQHHERLDGSGYPAGPEHRRSIGCDCVRACNSIRRQCCRCMRAIVSGQGLCDSNLASVRCRLNCH